MINRYIIYTLIFGVSFYFLISAFNFEDSLSRDTNNIIIDKRTCGTMDIHNMLMNSDPSYRLNHERVESNIKELIEKYKDRDNPSIISIPVVVHVIYNTAFQNVSMDQVKTQIDVLNKDFRKLNLDTANVPVPFKQYASDLQLTYCLARRDPNGDPTLGVTRTFTTVTNWGLNSDVKFTASGGHDAWPNNQYLNMWVCNLGAGLLGYATYPGGNPALDGVVINYTAFGTIGSVQTPYNKGRTATHEIGHWLSLIHIWGDDNGACWGTDQVDDTPNQGPEYYGCPTFPQITCDNAPNGAMYMNYMDYTDDACMFMFTAGQKQRTDAVMNGIRLPLQTSQGCQDISGIPICEFSGDSLIIPFGRDVQFTDGSAGIPTQWNWTFNGGNPAASTQQNPNVIYANPGVYTVKLKVTNSHGTDSLIKSNYIKVLGPPLSAFTNIYPPTFSRFNVAPGDTNKYNFSWTRSSGHPSIRYKFKMKRIAGNYPDYSFASNNSGIDTNFTVTGNFLDSMAKVILGPNYDSLRVTWRAYAYNGVDSLASDGFILTIGKSLIGIEQISSEIPEVFKLYNNYPNPFNPVTKIKFDIPSPFTKGGIQGGSVRLSIYNSLGQLIATLVNGRLSPGIYEVTWDASQFSSGVYFLRFDSDAFSDIKKMLLIK